MALQVFTDAVVYLDGALATMENQVSVDRNSGTQRVMTTALGLAGVSPGAKITEIKVRNAVPAAGFEFNAGAKMNGLQPVEVSIFAAGKTLTLKMIIEKDSFQHSVNSESQYEYDLVGGPSDWK